MRKIAALGGLLVRADLAGLATPDDAELAHRLDGLLDRLDPGRRPAPATA